MANGAASREGSHRVGSEKLTTGQWNWPTDMKLWFVMIKKNTKDDYRQRPVGQRLGLGPIPGKKPVRDVATDYTTDCKVCHIPARKDDWIYVRGDTTAGIEFTPEGKLKKPVGYRKWVYVGTPLTPNELNGGEAPFPSSTPCTLTPRVSPTTRRRASSATAR